MVGRSEIAPLDRTTAVEYASWFKALADGTRVQIVSLLARAGEPMSVGQVVAAVDVGQSTVSAHLK
ncbi:MAG: ArsR family transcriptional regulator, partial [Actinomycetia bacterium]|nr:ArsR family transcriptional regulator [Actinomycetes bacterium]